MKKKWIAYLCLIAIICGAVFAIFGNRNNVGEHSNKIDLQEYVDVIFVGQDGSGVANLYWTKIDGIEDIIQEKLDAINSQKAALIDSKSEDKIKEILELESKLLKIRNNPNYCTLTNNFNLSNGDNLTFDCRNETLKYLGYNFSETFNITVSNLQEVEINQNTQEDPITIFNPENKNEENGDPLQKTDGTASYYEFQGWLFVRSEDLNQIDTNELTKPYEGVILVCDDVLKLEQTLEYARLHKDIDFVYFMNEVFRKEDGFVNSEENRGFAYD